MAPSENTHIYTLYIVLILFFLTLSNRWLNSLSIRHINQEFWSHNLCCSEHYLTDVAPQVTVLHKTGANYWGCMQSTDTKLFMHNARSLPLNSVLFLVFIFCFCMRFHTPPQTYSSPSSRSVRGRAMHKVQFITVQLLSPSTTENCYTQHSNQWKTHRDFTEPHR